MSLVIEDPAVPLRTDDHGVIRVGKTRVPLDTVVYAFNQGASPEEIVMSYPTLKLDDVYAVVNYYLHNRTEVDGYTSVTFERVLWLTRKSCSSSNLIFCPNCWFHSTMAGSMSPPPTISHR